MPRLPERADEAPELTPTQSAAVEFMCERARPGHKAIVDGPAGSGKSTLLAAAAQRLGRKLVLCATTHKAARVAALRSGRGCVTAASLAQLPSSIASDDRGVLDRIATRTDRLTMMPGRKICEPGQIVVCDEASMISKELYKELVRYAAPGVLVMIGDGFQLPPTMAGGFSVFELPTADVDPEIGIHERFTLGQVFRQGAESPILAAANELRQQYAAGSQSPLEHLRGLPRIEMHEAIEFMTSQFKAPSGKPNVCNFGRNFAALTYKNAARDEITSELRRRLGFETDDIYPGEPMIVTQAPPKGYAGVSKGDIVTFLGWYDSEGREFEMVVPRGARGAGEKQKMRVKQAAVAHVDGRQALVDVLVYSDPNFNADMKQEIERRKDTAIVQAEFAYVITGHKSQGSQYRDTLVFYDEIYSTNRDHRFRWAYTTITRASDTCTICVLPRSAITSSTFEKPVPVSASVLALFKKRGA